MPHHAWPEHGHRHALWCDLVGVPDIRSCYLNIDNGLIPLSNPIYQYPRTWRKPRKIIGQWSIRLRQLWVLNWMQGGNPARGPAIIFSFIFDPISRFSQSEIYNKIDFPISRSNWFKSVSYWSTRLDVLCVLYSLSSSRFSKMDGISSRWVTELFVSV